MDSSPHIQTTSPPAGTGGLLRWVCTNNPFYVLSAALFLIGLRLSLGPEVKAVQVWTLMGSLAGYTLLLAGTALLLVRCARGAAAIWDDVRTLLLLVVLLFLATSVTFDEVLVLDPSLGVACSLAGLLFAVALSEGLLFGIRLRLPAGFRVPYYLLLALFFLYPPALSTLVDAPDGEPLLWGLFAFSSVAGLLFLTLLPAVRRGGDYVRDNGSPWQWPLYPWMLFGLLAFAVPARAFLLCWSMHLLSGGFRHSVVFGNYFLVPFALALAVLLLEHALVTGRLRPLLVALAVPAGLVAVVLLGHRSDPIYRMFVWTFTDRLGADPLYLTVTAAVAFYAYAALRRAPFAVEALTAALVGLAALGPRGLVGGAFLEPSPLPLVLAVAVQAGLGLRRPSAGRWLLAGGLAAGALLALPPGHALAPYRLPLAAHLVLLTVLAVGAAGKGWWARALRSAGVLLALAAVVFVMTVPLPLPAWGPGTYSATLLALLIGYGLWLRDRLAFGVLALGGGCWLGSMSWRAYAVVRETVAGLDHILASLALFGLAILISLGKSGLLGRWLVAWGWRSPEEEGPVDVVEVVDEEGSPAGEIQPG